jgi:prophage regulatory protein
MTCNILRLPEVIKITGLSRSSIYAMMDKEQFPKQVALGARAVGWLENEIREWISNRAGLRR